MHDMGFGGGFARAAQQLRCVAALGYRRPCAGYQLQLHQSAELRHRSRWATRCSAQRKPSKQRARSCGAAIGPMIERGGSSHERRSARARAATAAPPDPATDRG